MIEEIGLFMLNVCSAALSYMARLIIVPFRTCEKDKIEEILDNSATLFGRIICDDERRESKSFNKSIFLMCSAFFILKYMTINVSINKHEVIYRYAIYSIAYIYDELYTGGLPIWDNVPSVSSWAQDISKSTQNVLSIIQSSNTDIGLISEHRQICSLLRAVFDQVA